MARMLDRWEVEEKRIEEKKEVARISRQKRNFLTRHKNAANEDILRLIFDLQKRLEKLESQLDSVSSQFMRY